MPIPRRRLFQCLVLTLTSTAVLVVASAGAANATTSATVTTSSGPLRVRAAPTTAAAIVSSASNRSRVSVLCWVPGQYVKGTLRGTSQWDQLATGGYVSHGYISGGTIPRCGATTPAAPAAGTASAAGTTVKPVPPSTTVKGKVTTGSGPLRLRAGPSTLSALSGSLANGVAVAITCQVTGETVRGPQGSSALWYRLSSGLYVARSYISSGSVPACPTGTPSVPASAPTVTTYLGTVKSSDGVVRLRAGASTGSAIVGQVANGAKLSISCSVTGLVVAGTAGTSNQWDRLTTGSYIAHAYVVSGVIAACPGGSTVVTGEPSGLMTTTQFIAASVAPAQRAFREYGVPASVTIAQAIIESNWGRSSLAAQDHNFFGIKCSNGNRGPIATGCHTYSTTECGATCGLTTASFRSYATVTDSFRDHAVFLASGSRYRNAFNYTTNANQFLFEIWRAGYATDPKYGTLVTSIMAKYGLYRYDG